MIECPHCNRKLKLSELVVLGSGATFCPKCEEIIMNKKFEKKLRIKKDNRGIKLVVNGLTYRPICTRFKEGKKVTVSGTTPFNNEFLDVRGLIRKDWIHWEIDVGKQKPTKYWEFSRAPAKYRYDPDVQRRIKEYLKKEKYRDSPTTLAVIPGGQFNMFGDKIDTISELHHAEMGAEGDCYIEIKKEKYIIVIDWGA